MTVSQSTRRHGGPDVGDHEPRLLDSLVTPRPSLNRRPGDRCLRWASVREGIRHIAFAVEDIDAVVAGLRARGAELVGELERYEDRYRLCYVRGPEGIIIELTEQIG